MLSTFIIYPSMLSVLILLISQSVIRFSGSPHWFSESISPLSETDDVVHNVFLNTQCMRYCDVIHIAPYKICTCFKMKPIIHTPKHKCIFLMHLEWFSTQDIVCTEKLTLVLFKNVFFYTKSIVNKRWTVDPRYLFQSFSIT